MERQEASDLEEWIYAFILMATASVLVSITRFFIGPVFNVAFEAIVFYVPTAILFIIVVCLKMRQSKHSQTESTPRS